MTDQPPARISLPHLILDAALCLAAFGLFFAVIRLHVPSEDGRQVAFWSGATAACMTGVFWLALQMFKAVVRHQRERAAAE